MLIERLYFSLSFRFCLSFSSFFELCVIFFNLSICYSARFTFLLFILSALGRNLRRCIVAKFCWKGLPQNANNMYEICIRVRSLSNDWDWTKNAFPHQVDSLWSGYMLHISLALRTPHSSQRTKKISTQRKTQAECLSNLFFFLLKKRRGKQTKQTKQIKVLWRL